MLVINDRGDALFFVEMLILKVFCDIIMTLTEGGFCMGNEYLSFIKTGKKELSDMELEMLIKYCISKLGYLKNGDLEEVEHHYGYIIRSYHTSCLSVLNSCGRKKLDTFAKAASLMKACNIGLFKNKNSSSMSSPALATAQTAVEAALIWITNPYQYVDGEVVFMKECDFDVAFSSNPEFLSERKQILVDLLINKNGNGNLLEALTQELRIIYEAAVSMQYPVSEEKKDKKDSTFTKIKSIFRKNRL